MILALTAQNCKPVYCKAPGVTTLQHANLSLNNEYLTPHF
jgi:hypothetical protein